MIRIALVKKKLSVNQVGRYSGIANIKFLMCIRFTCTRTVLSHITIHLGISVSDLQPVVGALSLWELPENFGARSEARILREN